MIEDTNTKKEKEVYIESEGEETQEYENTQYIYDRNILNQDISIRAIKFYRMKKVRPLIEQPEYIISAYVYSTKKIVRILTYHHYTKEVIRILTNDPRAIDCRIIRRGRGTEKNKRYYLAPSDTE